MDNAEYSRTMALPTEPGRIPGDTEQAYQADASWLSAHEAAKRANPVERLPAVRTPMPVPLELYPEPTYTPLGVEPLRQWVPSEPARRPVLRSWFASLLRLSKPPVRKGTLAPIDQDPASNAGVVESREPSPVLSPEQEEYLQRIRAEERQIADERRRQAWAHLLNRYNGDHRPGDGNLSTGAAAALAPDPTVPSIQSEVVAEVSHWQDRSAQLSAELTRTDTERRLAVLKAAESEAYAAEARRRADAERAERQLAAERDAAANAAWREAERRAEELERVAESERAERLRVAEEKRRAEGNARAEKERLAAIARAEEERLAILALSKAKAKAEQDRQAALATAKVEAERERQAASDKAKAAAEDARQAELLAHQERTRISEEERREALRLAKAKAEAEEARRVEMQERDERLQIVVEERRAALALAAEAAAEAKRARQAQAREREERVLAEERERTASAALAETQALAAKARRAERLERDKRARAAEEQRAVVTARAEAAAYRENRRRKRSADPVSDTQSYTSPRLSRMAGLPPAAAPVGVVAAPVSVETARLPGDVRVLPAEHGVAAAPEPILVPSAAASVRQDVPQRPAVSVEENREPRLGPLYAGTPVTTGAATMHPAPVVHFPNPRARRGELLQRGIPSDSLRLSGWRRVTAIVFGTVGVLIAGLFVTGTAGRASVMVSTLIEKTPLPGFVLAQARPGGPGLEDPVNAADPGLSEYPGATAVVAAVANGFTDDLATLALSLDVVSGPPATWMTAEYLVRPTSFVEVGEYFRRLGEYAEDGPKLMLSLAEADIAFRSGFDAAGHSSESLAQQAMSVYVGLQSAWNDQLAAQRAFALAGADFDRFLRAEEGSLTFMLGEFGHRSAALATEATTMESNLQRALDRMNASEAVVQARMIDLRAATP